ncbi:MAG: hypothetical protein KAI43_10080 [Candidatus Aureabacteria bacterium]|nr:hypothetical protein [Candidatus Auribacterota bacterium]
MGINFENQKRNINQMFLSNQHTLTDIYRIESYVEQLSIIIKNLNNMIRIHENLDRIKPMEKNKMNSYAKLMNNIATEMQYLKATSQSMEDILRDAHKSCDFQLSISGKLIDMKKEVDKVIAKAEKATNLMQPL